VQRDQRWIEIPRRELVVGDVVRLSAGDLVPADVRLIEAVDLHVQQAALTGESLPMEKAASPGALASMGPQAPELLFFGTSIVSGTASAVVLAIGQATAFGDIVARRVVGPTKAAASKG